MPSFRELFTRAAPPEPTVPTVRITTGGRTTPYGAASLAAECAKVEEAGEGGRNQALNKAAFKVARLVPHEIAPDDAFAALYASGRRSGLPDREVREVLRETNTGALPKGQEHQRAVEHVEGEEVPAVKPWTPSSPDVVEGVVVEVPQAGDRPVEDQVEEDGEEVERTSWWARDLAAVLAGEDVEPDPAILRRLDGVALFYPGRVNVLLGESESGKTWVALLAVLQELRAGGRVLYLDFEDSPGSVVARLRALGARDEDLARFGYVNPDEPLSPRARRDLGDVLDLVRPSLVVLDGWNAAMGLLGLKLTDNSDATAFHQQLLRPLSRAGDPPPCVLAIDHVPKSAEARGKGGIGAQAKRGMVDGCAIRVEVEIPFGRGMVGRLKLSVDKDRPGKVREHAAGAVYVGTAVLTSDASTGDVRVEIEAGALELPSVAFSPLEDLMGRAWNHLDALHKLTRPGGGVSQRSILAQTGGRLERLRPALDELVAGGFVRTWEGPKLGKEPTRLYAPLRPYPPVSEVTPAEGGSQVVTGGSHDRDAPREEVVTDRVGSSLRRPVVTTPRRDPQELPLDDEGESTGGNHSGDDS